MTYNELNRRLTKAGCYATGKETNGHPEWVSPITGQKFQMSNHGAQEVKKGTLHSILHISGVDLVPMKRKTTRKKTDNKKKKDEKEETALERNFRKD